MPRVNKASGIVYHSEFRAAALAPHSDDAFWGVGSGASERAFEGVDIICSESKELPDAS